MATSSGIVVPISSGHLQSAADVLVVDEAMDEDEEGIEELEDHMVRYRTQAARTLFHQPRADDDTINSTRSLYDEEIVYNEIAGRTYVRDYYQPVDVEESTRTEILHSLFLHLLDNKLTTVPLHNPEKILDIGTGTGEWAIAMGEEYPKAEVVGTDIAKIQPGAVPFNVFFEIDDAEEEGGWTWSDPFDFVHFRSLSGAFRDWHRIYGEAYQHLKPGGWIEIMDFDHETPSNKRRTLRSFFDQTGVVMELLGALEESAIKSGRPRGVSHLQEKCLLDAGFTDVSVLERQIPMGSWPEDKELQKIGKHFLVTQVSGIEASCLRLLTEQAGWDEAEVKRKAELAVEEVKAVALDPEKGKGLSSLVRILRGRKPPDAGVEDSEEGVDWKGVVERNGIGKGKGKGVVVIKGNGDTNA